VLPMSLRVDTSQNGSRNYQSNQNSKHLAQLQALAILLKLT
jgi:hypothetical protein